ncbi:MAG: hypothetical protein WC319_06590 [Candidatus Paceibacterota bacterium]|jgi:hypothetical protein
MYKVNKKFVIIISIVALILILTITIFNFSSWGKKETQEEKTINQNQQEPINNQEQEQKKREEQIKYQKVLNEHFHSTEVVSSSSTSDLIELWTEASCPYLNLKDSYSPPSGFYVSAQYCPKDQIGTHGGCSNCKMSKIILRDGNNHNIEKLIPLMNKYCSKYQDVNDEGGFYINADEDKDKEILILCKTFYNNDYFAIFNKENEEIPILEDRLDCSMGSSCDFIEYLRAEDFDNDDVDEITYSTQGSFADRTSITWSRYMLYSFKEKGWFKCNGLCEEKCSIGRCGGLLNERLIENNKWTYSEDKKTWINN